MPITTVDLEPHIRGNNISYPIEFKKNNLPVDYTGWMLIFSMKYHPLQSDEEAVLRKEISITGSSTTLSIEPGISFVKSASLSGKTVVMSGLCSVTIGLSLRLELWIPRLRLLTEERPLVFRKQKTDPVWCSRRVQNDDCRGLNYDRGCK